MLSPSTRQTRTTMSGAPLALPSRATTISWLVFAMKAEYCDEVRDHALLMVQNAQLENRRKANVMIPNLSLRFSICHCDSKSVTAVVTVRGTPS